MAESTVPSLAPVMVTVTTSESESFAAWPELSVTVAV